MSAQARRDGLEGSDELARLMALLIRLQLKSQAQAIVELGRIGFAPKRIAELLGTTANTVNVQLAKTRGKT